MYVRPKKPTHFPAHENLYCAEWRSKSNTSTCCPQTPTGIFECFCGADFIWSCLSSWQLSRQKPKCQNRKQDCFQCVFYLFFQKKNWQGEKWSTIYCRRSGKVQFGNQVPWNLNIQFNTSVTSEGEEICTRRFQVLVGSDTEDLGC